MLTADYLELSDSSVTNLLQQWLSRQLDHKSMGWLDVKCQQLLINSNSKLFFTAFSAVARYTGKQALQLTPEDLAVAVRVRDGWQPQYWTVDQAARTLLLLALPQDNADKYIQTLEQLLTTADMGELVALYQALPLLPFPHRWLSRAAEGVRSNMTTVFNAVALHNPYPAEYFANLAWNQMVLKALFVGSPLSKIHGLHQRTNPQLVQMLLDYASERQAAKRPVSPELWQLVSMTND